MVFYRKVCVCVYVSARAWTGKGSEIDENHSKPIEKYTDKAGNNNNVSRAWTTESSKLIEFRLLQNATMIDNHKMAFDCIILNS